MSLEAVHIVHQAGLAKKEVDIRRKTAAAKIRSLRVLEKTNSEYIQDSTMQDYVEHMRGLTGFFDYIREHLSSNKVLDIGTGTSQGIDELSQSSLGKNLVFAATALTAHERMNLFKGKIHFTSGEVIRDIPSYSVGGILAKQSIGFSDSSLAARSINRVLVEGGILKATFRKLNGSYGNGYDSKYDEWGYSNNKKFTQELTGLRYDVAILPASSDYPNQDDILLAIKPGGDGTNTARELVEIDLYNQQVA